MRPGSMRVAWDRIIPQTNLTQDAIEGFASGNQNWITSGWTRA